MEYVASDFSLLVEELRKTLCALWQGSKGAISPESLFAVIWKVVPRFRYVVMK
jgi:ubiquitin carboxyl-terminal hydrolase 3